MHFYIAQGIGFIGMIVAFISFQKNDRRKFLWLQAIACMIFAAHFIFLGAFTGMIMNFAAIPRNLSFVRKHGGKQQILWTAVFVAAFVILGIFTWKNEFSLFPIFAMSCSTVVYSLRSPRFIRFLTLPVAALWLTYNIISLSIAGALTESFCVCSILIAIVRFDILRKKEVGAESISAPDSNTII